MPTTSGPAAHDDAVLPDHAAAVLDLVDLVPPGQATTYGDLADLVGSGGPRQAAQVMARHGAAVPWWRVVRADGSLPEHLLVHARSHWQQEAMPTYREGRAVDLRVARWEGPSPHEERGLSVAGDLL